MNDPNTPPDANDPRQDEYSTSTKRKRFRFKSSKRSHRNNHGEKSDRDDRTHHRDRHQRHRSSRHHHHHYHDHTSKRRKHSPPPTPSPTENYASRVSPETAFRESLFDALGDDEGAEYWETVYGQPIHTYSIPNIPKGPQGELEQMDDEEYASYVRAKMWERTREGMMEEEERRRQERVRQKRREEAMGREDEERRRFERAMDESLRRGQERRRKRVWKSAWEEYTRAWGEVDKEAGVVRKEGLDGRRLFRNLVFWPVESGKRRDVSRDAVEEFMRHAPTPSDGGDAPQDLMATLKAERIRWHPDKIQHRYGVLGIDGVVMQSVTEVFQIVDQMWNEAREKGS